MSNAFQSSPQEIFQKERLEEIKLQALDNDLKALSHKWFVEANKKRYSYHFDWLGRPIIQYPQDIIAIQEIVWNVKPDLIVETGIAHGGSLILSASLLALIDYQEALENRQLLDPAKPKRRVIGIDIDIRKHNRIAIENHPLSNRIDLIEGSSLDDRVVSQIHDRARNQKTVMVFLDSNHTHAHVLSELEAYTPIVSVGSYCVVFDTVIEHLPGSMFPDREWGPSNSPMSALQQFLVLNDSFEIDSAIDDKLLVSVAPQGFLKRVK